MDSILKEADRIVNGPRQDNYGHPSINFKRIASIWSVILGCEVTERQVGWMMVGLKMARDIQVPTVDNLVDTAGYAETIHKLGDNSTRRIVKIK